jgi:hypothetical protein
MKFQSFTRKPTSVSARAFAALVLAISLFISYGASAQESKGSVTTGWDDAQIEVVDGVKGETPKADKKIDVKPGKYTVIVRRPGFFPVKGTVEVAAGKTHTISFLEEVVPQRRQGEIWSLVGIGVGVTAVLTAAGLELAGVEDTPGNTALKASLAGVGSIMFTTSGALLHWIRTSRSNPKVKDSEFQINVGAAPIRGGAMLSAGGTF